MIRIEAIFVGEPKSITDEKGTWLSAIYRTRVEGPIELRERGLAGDRVADMKNHGRPGQAVCVHPIIRSIALERICAVLGHVLKRLPSNPLVAPALLTAYCLLPAPRKPMLA